MIQKSGTWRDGPTICVVFAILWELSAQSSSEHPSVASCHWPTPPDIPVMLPDLCLFQPQQRLIFRKYSRHLNVLEAVRSARSRGIIGKTRQKRAGPSTEIAASRSISAVNPHHRIGCPVSFGAMKRRYTLTDRTPNKGKWISAMICTGLLARFCSWSGTKIRSRLRRSQTLSQPAYLRPN